MICFEARSSLTARTKVKTGRGLVSWEESDYLKNKSETFPIKKP